MAAYGKIHFLDAGILLSGCILIGHVPEANPIIPLGARLIRSYASQTVEGAEDSAASTVEDMAVNHGCLDVSVPKESLNGSDVVASFEELCCEGMSKRMARSVFRNTGFSASLLDCLLHDGLMKT